MNKKIVYFGSWQHHAREDEAELIFSLDWEFNEKGHRSKGFRQSSNHIDLIIYEKFKLKTFTQVAKDRESDAPIGIKKIIPGLRERRLVTIGEEYLAYPESYTIISPDHVDKVYLEGAKKIVTQSLRERNPAARKRCLDIYGYTCRVCDFDFERTYGTVLGSGYIHVHHLEKIANKDGVHQIDPTNGLRPVCPNCHAMIHKRSVPIEINEMRRRIGKVELDNP